MNEDTLPSTARPFADTIHRRERSMITIELLLVVALFLWLALLR